MCNKQFRLKLEATYKSDKNDIQQLVVYIKEKGDWNVLDLSVKSPGFLLFINGLFSCQHLYMRTNSAECNVELESTIGELFIETNEVWQIQVATVSFDSKIKSGVISEKDFAYIEERMHHCPVSSNLPEHLKLKVNLKFS